MFTGIIREQGKVLKIEGNKGNLVLTIAAKEVLKKKKTGESIAVDGACLTIIDLKKDCFQVEAMPETTRKTILGNLRPGDLVNLEPALTLSESLDGHLVQGHIDSLGVVKEVKLDGNSKILTIKFPELISKYVAYKGSITINGVSLTVIDIDTDTFSVALIPHTLENTNLNLLKTGDKVNLEVDMIARYLDRLLQNKNQQTEYEWLMERGFV